VVKLFGVFRSGLLNPMKRDGTMKKSQIVSYTSEELKQMPDESDWEANAAMTEEEIRAAIADDPDDAELDIEYLRSHKVAKQKHRFIMCIVNEGQEARLTLLKVYKVIPDGDADRLKMVRVIDDRGEDTMHPARWFVAVQLSVEAEQGFELVTA
jgi:hypothetical protein